MRSIRGCVPPSSRTSTASPSAARRRSCPQLARSWAMRTISFAPPSTSARASVRISFVERDRWSPRNVGIAQNPQRRSQPSAIFTYAHGAFDAGRGRLSKSNAGVGRLRSATGVEGTICSVRLSPNPATRSTSGSASASSSP